MVFFILPLLSGVLRPGVYLYLESINLKTGMTR
jgi:hypothetical protein